MTRKERIEQAISEENDPAKLRLLNRAWWAEYFKAEREEVRQMVEEIRKKAA